MNLAFTDEQEQLRELVRRFLEECSSEQSVREQMSEETGFDPTIWKRMASELGLLGLIIPEEYGGVDLGAVELAIVMEEMGRSLLCAPYFSTAVMAATTLLEAGDEEAKKLLLPGIASGERIIAVAIEEENGDHDLANISTSATADGDRFLLTGVKTPVIDGNTADTLLVAARTAVGLSLFIVDADAQGLSRKALPPLDLTRKLSHIELEQVSATLLGQEGEAEEVLNRVLNMALTALAAEQTGGAQVCLELAVQYAKDRLQFGRPIGSFQSIKHKCADMLVAAESARSAAYYAAFSAVEDEAEVPVAVAMAKSKCSEAFTHNAAENVQIHGGIGFTWEDPSHLYLKRAKSSALLLGDAAYHRQKLALAIGL